MKQLTLQQECHLQSISCGMGSLRPGSFQLDPRGSYEPPRHFVKESTETI